MGMFVIPSLHACLDILERVSGQVMSITLRLEEVCESVMDRSKTVQNECKTSTALDLCFAALFSPKCEPVVYDVSSLLSSRNKSHMKQDKVILVYLTFKEDFQFGHVDCDH